MNRLNCPSVRYYCVVMDIHNSRRHNGNSHTLLVLFDKQLLDSSSSYRVYVLNFACSAAYLSISARRAINQGPDQTPLMSAPSQA
jgi:hypothetical protein